MAISRVAAEMVLLTIGYASLTSIGLDRLIAAIHAYTVAPRLSLDAMSVALAVAHHNPLFCDSHRMVPRPKRLFTGKSLWPLGVTRAHLLA